MVRSNEEKKPRVTFSGETTQSFNNNGDIYWPWMMEPGAGDEEAPPRDPGVNKPQPKSFTAKDYEGHRAHTMYVGVHLPGEKRHRKHKHTRANSRDSDDSSEERPRQFMMGRRGRLASITDDGETFTPPAQRVQFILGEDADDNTHEIHPLFSEMEELYRDDDCLEWRETARWIKFEEDVEEGGNRWSKPHVATLTLHSLFELRSLLLNGSVVLDMEAVTFEQVTDLALDHMLGTGAIQEDVKEQVREILLQRHRHLHERRKESNMTRLPIIRSLADIGRSHSSSKNMEQSGSVSRSSSLPTAQEPFPTPAVGQPFLTVPGMPPAGGGGGGEGMERSPSSVSMSRNHSFADLNGEHKGNLGFMKKIPPGAEASNIMVGEVDFLEKPISAFIRLKSSTCFADLTEVPVPTRFMFILLGPMGGLAGFHEIGRAMATLMSDEVFHEVAYRARNRTHLLAAVDEFLDAVTVLPPGEWDPTIRIEPPAAVPSQDQRKRPEKALDYVDPEILEQKLREESGLSRTGRLFGGLVNDLKRKAPWYWSDFKDALAMQCVASWIFLYFACLSPIITFGGLLSEATGKSMAAIESLISGFVCGMGYGFFSGQPLCILGSTGPVLVFETIVYDFCGSVGWDYLSFRLWIGLWVAFILFVLVAVDASALVCYITRFTEENFATLIAFIFIYKAIENVLRIGKKFPVDTHRIDYNSCFCEPPALLSSVDGFNWTTLERDACLALNGSLVGAGCNMKYVPDVYLMSIILFFGTFLISVILKDFKTALFFPSKVRQFVSDFAVIIAIASMSFLDYATNIPTPKLEVPSDFKPTLPGRGWVIPPFVNPIWTIPIAALPAVLGTILIFMDQQITAVIINRKENKLKKGCGYHLDLFVLSILIALCSIMGLPWFVAATVLSINHVNSLKLETECAAPGDKPQFLGVREQRVTHIMIFLMIGLSVTITPLLGHIPMPVLFGVFLYMGAAALKGLQFFDRLLIMFMPAKYQPDYMFLRKVPIKRVHMFTLIQLACLIMLWLIKSFSQTSIFFPLMLVVMVGIRKLLDFIFTQRELKILDDLMPDIFRRNEEDEKELGEGEERQAMEDNLQIPLANGNIMKIPLASINISEEVPKTGIWKQVNNSKNEKKKNSMKLKRRLSSKEASTDEERARLAPMAEAEEDDGRVTIKVDKARNLKTLEHRSDFYSDNGSETTV